MKAVIFTTLHVHVSFFSVQFFCFLFFFSPFYFFLFLAQKKKLTSVLFVLMVSCTQQKNPEFNASVLKDFACFSACH